MAPIDHMRNLKRHVQYVGKYLENVAIHYQTCGLLFWGYI